MHRHPKRVLRLSSVSSCSPEDQSSELKARFLVNGSHFHSVVGGLNNTLDQKYPQEVHLPQPAACQPPGVILPVVIWLDQLAQARPSLPVGLIITHNFCELRERCKEWIIRKEQLTTSFET